MKLELKLSSYLPYKLKGVEWLGAPIHELTSIRADYKEPYCWTPIKSFGSGRLDCKALLHPMSDLMKEIEIDGVKFIPFEGLCLLTDYSEYVEQIEEDTYEMNTPYRWPYELVDNLLKWHFDIFGLIKEGLAIDINTLKDND